MEVKIKSISGTQPDAITVTIQDTGIGMAADELANIFTVFYQTASW